MAHLHGKDSSQGSLGIDDDNKKAKTTSASHGQNASTPPLHLDSLSDTAHDAIASSLVWADRHHMMETSPSFLKAYGGLIEVLQIPSVEGKDPRRLLSLIRRRPRLVEIVVVIDERMEALVEAMRAGCLYHLQKLGLYCAYGKESKLECLSTLFNALADGLCPKINRLVLHLPALAHEDEEDKPSWPSLCAAMRSRMEKNKGCCPLKSLEITSYPEVVLSILSSGACEILEELKLDSYGQFSDQALTDLSEWLTRTKALQVRVFNFPHLIADKVKAALCEPHVAPKLEVLHMLVDGPSISLFTQAIGQGAWPKLSDIKIELEHLIVGDAARRDIQPLIPPLLEAIGQGAPQLKTLSLSGTWGAFEYEGGVALARMLRHGGCPRLEELDLHVCNIQDDVMVELARALEEGGAPCRTTLRRIELRYNAIGGAGMRALMEAMERGALYHLQHLSFQSNTKIADHGVVALAMAMTSRGILSSLKTLDLSYVGMTELGAWSLFKALREHKHHPLLKELDISSNYIGDEGILHLAMTIEAGALRHLEVLSLGGVGMTSEGFKSLIKALVTGCPLLLSLDVQGNKLGDMGMEYLIEVIKVKGAMRCLRVLTLDQIKVGYEGAKAFMDALGDDRSCCPGLAFLSMIGDVDWGSDDDDEEEEGEDDDDDHDHEEEEEGSASGRRMTSEEGQELKEELESKRKGLRVDLY